MTDLNQLNRAIQAHADCARQIKELEASIADRCKALEATQERIEAFLLSVLTAENPKVVTVAGSAERVPTTFYSIADWDVFIGTQCAAALRAAGVFNADLHGDFIIDRVVRALLDQGPIVFFKREVKKTAVAEFIEAHKQPPPGIKVTTIDKAKITPAKRKAYENE